MMMMMIIYFAQERGHGNGSREVRDIQASSVPYGPTLLAEWACILLPGRTLTFRYQG